MSEDVLTQRQNARLQIMGTINGLDADLVAAERRLQKAESELGTARAELSKLEASRRDAVAQLTRLTERP